MRSLNETALAAETGFNTHALVTLGIAAIAVWVGWKIFRLKTS
ncbi:MAG: hypothetical protein PHX87_03240 [Candidatus Peribacteraceae bacterium]|nr:hypothetical protein [Candidatus Peribacteraceae bacterium]MDD5742422.1 hypothetical protein [Candidatus Peribacteraceae bacterium]